MAAVMSRENTLYNTLQIPVTVRIRFFLFLFLQNKVGKIYPQFVSVFYKTIIPFVIKTNDKKSRRFDPSEVIFK